MQRNRYSVLNLNSQNIGHLFRSENLIRQNFSLKNVNFKGHFRFGALYYSYTLPVCSQCILCRRILLYSSTYIRKRIGSTQDLDLSCKSHLMVTTISFPVCQRFSDILQNWGRSLFIKEEENFAVGRKHKGLRDFFFKELFWCNAFKSQILNN